MCTRCGNKTRVEELVYVPVCGWLICGECAAVVRALDEMGVEWNPGTVDLRCLPPARWERVGKSWDKMARRGRFQVEIFVPRRWRSQSAQI